MRSALCLAIAVLLCSCQSKADRRLRVIDERIIGPDVEEPLPDDRGEAALREAFGILNL